MTKLTFDLHQTRLEFLCTGFQFIWAAIIGAKSVWFRDIECGEVTRDGERIN